MGCGCSSGGQNDYLYADKNAYESIEKNNKVKKEPKKVKEVK